MPHGTGRPACRLCHPEAVHSLTLAFSMSREGILSREIVSVWENESDPEAPTEFWASGHQKKLRRSLRCFIRIYDGFSHAVYDEYPGFYGDVFSVLEALYEPGSREKQNHENT